MSGNQSSNLNETTIRKKMTLSNRNPALFSLVIISYSKFIFYGYKLFSKRFIERKRIWKYTLMKTRMKKY